MDDTIQILVFVVTFIVFIVSAVLQQKKKPDAKGSNLDNIVESIFGIPQESPRFTREEIRNDYFQGEYSESDAVQNESFKVPKEKMVGFLNTEGINGIVDPVVIDTDEGKVEDMIRPFDLRQAVIYSEILNRKYF